MASYASHRLFGLVLLLLLLAFVGPWHLSIALLLIGPSLAIITAVVYFLVLWQLLLCSHIHLHLLLLLELVLSLLRLLLLLLPVLRVRIHILALLLVLALSAIRAHYHAVAHFNHHVLRAVVLLLIGLPAVASPVASI